MVDPVFLDVASDLGGTVHRRMQLGGSYAYAGRDWVCSRVARLPGGQLLWRRCTTTTTSPGWKSTNGRPDVGLPQGSDNRLFRGNEASMVERWVSSPVILEGVDSEESKTALQHSARCRPCSGA